MTSGFYRGLVFERFIYEGFPLGLKGGRLMTYSDIETWRGQLDVEVSKNPIIKLKVDRGLR